MEEATKKPFWLQDNFAPIQTEWSETNLPVTGAIPPDLCGRYLRAGPNPQTGESAHWFLGDGMIHGVELANGNANWYRNRFVRTPPYEERGSDPMAGINELGRSLANTHVIAHAGRILALEELHLPFELAPNLDTKGPCDFDGKLRTGMTAHPKICGETGELLFFGYRLTPPYLTYHRVSTHGELVQSEEIDVKGATMVHDFNVTRNFVVFMDLPVIWDLEALAETGIPVRWSDDYGARLGVMPRNGSNDDLVWYEIDPCYAFHPMNAWERGEEIIIDVCRLERAMQPDKRDANPLLHRWTINRGAGSVSEQPLDDLPVEFPRVRDDCVGLPYRYGYTAEMGSVGPVARAIRKYDMTTGASTAHVLPEECTGGEAVFVPAQDGTAEDDGYLLTFVHDARQGRSELRILNATQLEKEPLARIHLPTRVPAGFHGSWIPDAV